MAAMKNLPASLLSTPVQSLFYLLIAGLCAALLATPYYMLAFLPGLAILLFLLLSRHPSPGYYTIIALIPFAAYRKMGGIYRFIDLPWIIGIFLLLILIIRYLPRHEAPRRLKSNLWPLFLVFFIISIISTLLSPYRTTALTNIFLMISAVLFIALSFIFISKKGLIRTMPAVLIWSVSVGAFLAVLGFFFNIHLFVQEQINGTFERGIGGALDPNNQSLMIIFILPLLVQQLFSSRRFLPRSVTVILLVINLLGILSTYSRGGSLILILTTGLLILEHRWRFKAKHVGIALAAVGLSLALLLTMTPSSYWDRQANLINWQEKTLTRRATYLAVGWEAFKQRPLLGNGPGTFRDIYARTDYARELVQEGKTLRRFAHNTYMEALAGLGIAGLLIFLAILWRALRNFSFAKRTYLLKGDREMSSLIGSYRVSFIAMTLYIFILSAMYHKYLLLSLALSSIAWRLASQDEEGT